MSKNYYNKKKPHHKKKKPYYNSREKFTIKFSNIPNDITENELIHLLKLWHPINRVNVNHYKKHLKDWTNVKERF